MLNNKFNALVQRWAARLRLAPVVVWLLAINLAVFIAFHLLGGLGNFWSPNFREELTEWLAVPASLQNSGGNGSDLLHHPWTLLTYMFFHEGFLHLLFNMLWFVVFALLFLRYATPKKLISLYLLGGLAGALVYIVTFNLVPYFQSVLSKSYALGASAAVMAVTLAATMQYPNEKVYIYGLIGVKLKYLAIITIALDLLSLASDNAGGHLAHLGGAAVGLLYQPTLNWFQKLPAHLRYTRHRRSAAQRFTYTKNTSSPHAKYRASTRDTVDEREIEAILKKLAQHGYSALSTDEKEKLFRKRS